MKQVAIEKAQLRIDRARQALQRIEASKQFDEFESAWGDFLSAIKSIHSIFEASSAKDPKAQGWYGRKVHERRKDPLLRYVHHARNAHEYGLEPVTTHVPGGLGIGTRGEAVHVEYMGPARDGSGRQEIVLRPVDGKLPTVRHVEPQAVLVQVKDERFGDTFDPPTEHLGKPLENRTPSEVAALALVYHEKLVEEAERFVT